MDFREEYRKSVESNSPDREAIDRMKAAVMSRLNEEETAGEAGSAAETPQKHVSRRLPVWVYAGAGAAACAVIAIAAANILPNVGKTGGMVSSGSSSDAYMQETASETAVDCEDTAAETREELAKDDDFAADTAGIPQTDEPGQGIAESVNADADDFVGNPENGAAFPADSEPQESAVPTEGKDETEGAAGTDDTAADDRYDNSRNPGCGYSTAEVPDSPDSADITEEVSGDMPDNDCGDFGYTGEASFGSYDGDFATEEAADEWDEVCDATEEAEKNTLIIFSGKGWVAYAGERYDLVSAAPVSGTAETAYDPVSGKYYTVIANGEIISVYENARLVGSYKRK